MEQLSARIYERQKRPVRVVQFGEGNFLRAFADDMLDILNERTDFNGSIAIVKPIPSGSLEAFEAQDCLYSVCLRGMRDGVQATRLRLVESVDCALDAYAQYDAYARLSRIQSLRFILSNTTEAGIVYDPSDDIALCPPKSFPGKLTKFLYERAQHFDYAMDKGLVMLPVELIDDNGAALKKCVLKCCDNWRLPQAFVKWLNEACVFASTLVDRIVTGAVRDEETRHGLERALMARDALMVSGEQFALWVIEAPERVARELPFQKAGLPVLFTDSCAPFKQRKVRILNGAHTCFVPAAFLMGHDTVLDAISDAQVSAFLRGAMFEEIIPTLNLPYDDLTAFAQAVLERFQNPFIEHRLLSITLNCVSKWRARVLPSLLEYVARRGALPRRLCFSLAAMIAFLAGGARQGDAFVGIRDGQPYQIMDEESVLSFFSEHRALNWRALCERVLKNTAFFGRDLTGVDGLEDMVTAMLIAIETKGVRVAMREACGGA